MKSIISVISIIVCAILLYFGQTYWKEKTDVSVKESETSTKTVEQQRELDNILSYTKNWPTESVETFQTSLMEGKPFKMSFLGSNTVGTEPGSWQEIIQASLMDVYGMHIQVSNFQYDLTSIAYLNQNKVKEVIKEQPNLIIFEPFTLKDNGNVSIEDSLQNVASIIATVKKSLPETVFIIQPSYPLYNATFYPIQVAELKKFAEDQEIPYINHWEAWPDPSTAKMKKYLTENSSQPSQEGHKVWADYLIHYLIEL